MDDPVGWPGEVRPSDPVAGGVKNIASALKVLPQYTAGGTNPTPYQQVLGIEDFARARFFHSYSEYTFCENWALNLIGVAWHQVSAIISPDDILTRPYAGCSQQGIIVQELLKRSGFEYGTFGVRYPVPHFASVAKIGPLWYFVDSWGPLPRGTHRLIPVRELFSNKRLLRDFPSDKGAEFVKATNSGLAQILHVNQFPGPRGLLFQKLCLLFSRLGWLFFLTIFMLLKIRKYWNHRD